MGVGEGIEEGGVIVKGRKVVLSLVGRGGGVMWWEVGGLGIV